MRNFGMAALPACLWSVRRMPFPLSRRPPLTERLVHPLEATALRDAEPGVACQNANPKGRRLRTGSRAASWGHTLGRLILLGAAAIHLVPLRAARDDDGRKGAFIMRAQRARRLAAASAAGMLMAGGAVITTAGTAAAAAPAVHTQVTTNRCFDHNDGRCFDRDGFGFGHRGFCFFHPGFCFDHRFDHRFDNGGVVIIVVR
ncbi:hypothetical protein [Streptomyces sp. NPDC054834]